MKISLEGLSLIKKFEGCKLEAYKCSAGVWTIGYGHTAGVKEGDVCTLISDDVSWKINSKLKDGEYKVGIRPHNITTYKEGPNSLEISGKVLISELSGSESLIHFTNGDLNWVSLSNGIHQKNVGEQTKLFMNSDEFLYFDETNKLVNNV